MSNQISDENGPEEEILYQGEKIPKILRFVYVIFGTWAVFYVAKNLFPDLMTWLKK